MHLITIFLPVIKTNNMPCLCTRYCAEAKEEVEAMDRECSQLAEATSLLDAEAVSNNSLILGLREELREVHAEVARLHGMMGTIEDTPVYDVLQNCNERCLSLLLFFLV